MVGFHFSPYMYIFHIDYAAISQMPCTTLLFVLHILAMAKAAVVISTAPKQCINLPGAKDSFVPVTTSSVGFDTIPGPNNNPVVISRLAAVISHKETFIVIGVTGVAETHFENIIGRVVSVVEEEHLFAAALFLQTKAALGAAGINVHVDCRDVEVRVGLGNDVELIVVCVIDSTHMKHLRHIIVIAAIELDNSAFFERIAAYIHTKIDRIKGDSFDLHDIMIIGNVIRTIGTIREMAIVGVATDDGSVPACCICQRIKSEGVISKFAVGRPEKFAAYLHYRQRHAHAHQTKQMSLTFYRIVGTDIRALLDPLARIGILFDNTGL